MNHHGDRGSTTLSPAGVEIDQRETAAAAGAANSHLNRQDVIGCGTALIIGGGLAGTLAAWALRGVAKRIIVIERDQYPARPDYRPGVPQGRHAHLLLEAGHQALNRMLPGVYDDLLAAGATRVAMSGDLRWLSSAGWMAEHPSKIAFLSCTRPVIDHVIRARVTREPSVQILEGAEVVGVLGTPHRVTGVRIRERGDGQAVRDLHAQLVIDASGRRSAMTSWLSQMGCRTVPDEKCDAGVAYASRMFELPPGTDLGFRALYLQTKATSDPRTGSLLPVEGGRYLVSLGGMRGATPAPGVDGFEQMLAQMRDPALRDILSTARPVSEVRGFRPGPSVRRHYDRHCPDGLVVLGDALCTYNPVYGQGMSVAALSAEALRSIVLRHGGIGNETARAARKKIAQVSKAAWMMSASEDARWPSTIAAPASLSVRMQHRLLDRVLDRATTDVQVTAAFHEVMSLVAPPTALLRPRVLAPVLFGGRR